MHGILKALHGGAWRQEVRDRLDRIDLLDMRVLAVLTETRDELRSILAQLRALNEREARMATTIQDILAGVTAESEHDDSIIALLNNVFQLLQNAGVPQATIDSIKSVIDANVAKIDAAVLANTPQAPAPTP